MPSVIVNVVESATKHLGDYGHSFYEPSDVEKLRAARDRIDVVLRRCDEAKLAKAHDAESLAV